MKIRILAAVLTAVFLFSTIGTVTVYAKGDTADNGYYYADIALDTALPIIPITEGSPSTQTLTPLGTGTVIDNVTNENNIEFFTITSTAGNIFFLIIDRQREAENVLMP